MFLGKDGKYYLDEKQNVEITSELIYRLYEKIATNFFFINTFSFVYNIENIDDNFLYKDNTLFYVDKNKKEFQIKIQSVKIIFRVEKDDKKEENTRDIFTYEQFEKNLEIFGITFPWSGDTVVTKDIIIERINRNDPDSLIIIENIDFNKLIRPKVLKLDKFKDFSTYITYYLKNKVNIEKYEENGFLDKNIFNIDPEKTIEFFFPTERKIFLTEILNEFKNGAKEYFFTGLHSIGKTFTLLAFNILEEPLIKKAYFNLETFRIEKKFFEIIIYESQNLFENKDKWKEAFVSLKNRINDSNNFLLIILNLIKLIKESYTIEGINYVIILDQIKFEKLEDNEYKQINSIRDYIQQTKNFYLIGCCSINYKGVKDILFYNWDKTQTDPNTNNIPNLKYIKSSKFSDKNNINYNMNKYLKLLGNIPRFKNIQDKLNSKIVNLFIKKTKEKFLKFYGVKKFYEFENIGKIPVLKQFKEKKDFLEELNRIPFKYFKINEEEKMFDFSCPIIKRALEELLEENELNQKGTDYNSELGWYFEKRVIYAMKVTNLIPKNTYIDNSYLIPTIFLPHKVGDLDHKENSLFYFEYCNVRRYDCAIYLGLEKAFLLIQISINKPKNKLDQYNPPNFESDLEDMQKFIKINNLKVKKYYLLFILLYSNYISEKELKAIKEKGFPYIRYDIDEKKFIGEIEKNDDFYEINNTINPNKNIDISTKHFEFGKINGSFNYEYKGKYHKYYAEKGMSLERFFSEIFGEDIKEEFKIITGFIFSNYFLSSFKNTYNLVFSEGLNTSVLLLNYQDDKIIYGTGESKKSFNWNSYNMIDRTTKKIQNKPQYSGMCCFLFKKNKLIYPIDDIDDNLKKIRKGIKEN